LRRQVSQRRETQHDEQAGADGIGTSLLAHGTILDEMRLDG
jgi:hypothetical protein